MYIRKVLSNYQRVEYEQSRLENQLKMSQRVSIANSVKI